MRLNPPGCRVAKRSEVASLSDAPNPSIERTSNSWLRHLLAAAHVKRWAA